MPEPTLDCPTAEDLAAYLGGRLDDDVSAEIEDHFRECDRCHETLRVVDCGLGTVVIRPPVDPFASEESCDRAIAEAEDLGRRAAERTHIGDRPAQNTVDSTALGDVGHYRLLTKLGQGGMGTVFKALHTNLDRIVALKVLSPEALGDPDAIARFGREMRAVGKVRHPNIVTAHDAGEIDGMHYLVMELIEGEDLGSLAERSGPLPVPEACALVRQAALGLQHAHENGMIHRDIKPSNLMLDREGVVKVLDMGLARLGEHHAGSPDLTATGQLMGTLDYMAPEQGSDTHGIDARADVYSLGATLYKLLSGAAPFEGQRFDTPIKKLRALAIEEPEPLASKRPGLPTELCDLVQRMLAKAPSDRPATPQAIADALDDFAAGARLERLLDPSSTESVSPTPAVEPGAEPAPTRHVSSPIGRETTERRRNAWPWILCGLVLPLAVYLAASAFFVQTEFGAIRIEVTGANADDVSVSVRDTDVLLTGVGDDPVRLTPGEKTLHVAYQDGAVAFDTDTLKLQPNDELTVRIEFRPGEIVALRQDTRTRIGGVIREDSEGHPPIAVAPFRGDVAREHQSRWARHLEEEVETTNSIGTKLVLIPPGRFQMNTPIEPVETELRQHYWIGKFVVTQREWRAVMGTEPWKGQDNVLEGDDVPVTYVNWKEATEFCQRLTARERENDKLPSGWEYRLPTEAEWEHACRAGSRTFYWFGHHATDLRDHAWFDENTEGEAYAHAVGGKKPNPWGLHDVHGNVWEWCLNGYAKQPEGGVDPRGPTGGVHRVVRGGTWNGGASGCGSHFRAAVGHQRFGSTHGFRIVLARSDR